MLLTLNLYLVIDLFQPNNLYAQSRESSQLESQTRNMENKISIFPNPVNDLLNVNLDLSNGEKTNYKIFDLNSKIVNFNELLNNQIDVSNLTKGVYILEINNTNNTNKIKFIKE